MEVIIVLGVVFLVVLVMVTLASLFNFNENGPESVRIHFGTLLTGLIGSLISLVVIGTGVAYATNNHFYNMHEEYQIEVANVGVMREKMETLKPELKDELYAQYQGLEKELVDAVRNRDTGELKALFERYPKLLASLALKDVMREYVSLTEDVARAKLVVNAVARAFNVAHNVRPAKWFAPNDLPNSLPLLPERK